MAMEKNMNDMNDVSINETPTSAPAPAAPFVVKHPVLASTGRIAATGAIGAITVVASAFLWHLGTTLAQRVLPARYVITLRGPAPSVETPAPVSAS
jgi:hypothetical protein